MKITHKKENNTLFVSLYGEIDESCAVEARQKLDSALSGDGFNKAVFDFAGVSFMDSTGIGMLIGRYKLLKARGIPLLLRSPQNVVDRLLSLSGIYEIMPKVNK